MAISSAVGAATPKKIRPKSMMATNASRIAGMTNANPTVATPSREGGLLIERHCQHPRPGSEGQKLDYHQGGQPGPERRPLVNSKSKQSMQVDKKGQLRANNVLLAGDLTTGADPTPDPLAGLEPPGSTTARDIADYMTTSGGRRIYALEPGNYDGKIEFRDSDVVRFKPGTYVFNEEVKFKNQASAYGSGVTIFMEGKKSQKFETSGTIKLSPPKSGPLEGITIFLDPTSNGKVFFKKDADIAVSGTIYAPNGEVRFQKVDAELGFVDTDLDEEIDADSSGMEESTSGSLEAQIIARRFKIDKQSHLRVNGDAIESRVPYVGIVE